MECMLIFMHNIYFVKLYIIDNGLLTLRGVNKAGKVKIGLKNINNRMGELVFSHNGKQFYPIESEYENLMLV